MTKEVVETLFKFYIDLESANKDDYVLLLVDVEGGQPPHSVVKTVIKDINKITPIGDTVANVPMGNLSSANFQLVIISRETPIDIPINEKVYIFEAFID